MPVSLGRLRALRSPFDHARDPLISAQLKAIKQSERQRHEQSGRGSTMVKGDRPFPALRPRDEDDPLRVAFDRAWLQEQRAAVLARLQAQRAVQEQDQARELNRPLRTQDRARA
jgi:hypothetical protein